MILATFVLCLVALMTVGYARTTFGRHPSVSWLMFGGLLVIHVIPLFVYIHLTGPDTLVYEAALSLANREEVLARLLWAMSILFVGLISGSHFASVFAPRQLALRRSASPRELAGPVINTLRASRVLRLSLWAVAVAMIVVILVEGQPAKILTYFTSGDSEVEKIQMRAEFGGTDFYLYNIFLYSVAPFVVMALWCIKRATPKDVGIAGLFWLFFMIVLTGKIATLSKAPPVIFLMQMTLLVTLVSGVPIKLGSAIKLGAFTVFLFAIVVSYTIPGIGLGAIFEFLYYRVFDIPNEVLVEYFSAFPVSLPHNWPFGFFGNFFRGDSEPSLQNYHAVAEVVRGNLLSTSNAMFLGDAWADYSGVGVFFSPFAAGAVVRWIDIYAERNGRTDEWACLVTGCAFGIFTLFSTTFTTALITGGLALIPLASLLFRKKV